MAATGVVVIHPAIEYSQLAGYLPLVSYLGWDLGREKKIRINAISAGPMRTLSSAGISGFDQMRDHAARKACLERNVEFEELGTTGLYLLGPASGGMTGEVLHVDCGYSIVGL